MTGCCIVAGYFFVWGLTRGILDRRIGRDRFGFAGLSGGRYRLVQSCGRVYGDRGYAGWMLYRMVNGEGPVYTNLVERSYLEIS